MSDPDLSHDAEPRRAARPSDLLLLLLVVSLLGVALVMIFRRVAH
jgi:hypothetical protein